MNRRDFLIIIVSKFLLSYEDYRFVRRGEGGKEKEEKEEKGDIHVKVSITAMEFRFVFATNAF